MRLDRLVPAALAVALLAPALAAGQAPASPADVGIALDLPADWEVVELDEVGLFASANGDMIYITPFVLLEGDPSGADRIRAFLLEEGFDGGDIVISEPRHVTGHTLYAGEAYDPTAEFFVRDIYAAPGFGVRVHYSSVSGQGAIIEAIDAVRIVDPALVEATALRAAGLDGGEG